MPPAATARPAPSVGFGSVDRAATRRLTRSGSCPCATRVGFAGSSGGMPNSPGGSSTPLAANRAMNVGRMPVGVSVALDLAVVHPGLLEGEDVLGQDLVVLDPVDLGDVDDLARAVLESGGVDDEVDRRGDLLADGAQRHLVAGHEDHRLEAPEHVGRAVGVAGRQRAVLAGGHRLEHVQRFARAALADDDPVGAHVEGVAQEVADGDLAVALEVRWARLEGDDVLLAELQLGGVLDGDDPLVARG